MLAGEEPVGAKQNRILNTTILLKKHSETTIPVSCTKQVDGIMNQQNSEAPILWPHRI